MKQLKILERESQFSIFQEACSGTSCSGRVDYIYSSRSNPSTLQQPLRCRIFGIILHGQYSFCQFRDVSWFEVRLVLFCSYPHRHDAFRNYVYVINVRKYVEISYDLSSWSSSPVWILINSEMKKGPPLPAFGRQLPRFVFRLISPPHSSSSSIGLCGRLPNGTVCFMLQQHHSNTIHRGRIGRLVRIKRNAPKKKTASGWYRNTEHNKLYSHEDSSGTNERREVKDGET